MSFTFFWLFLFDFCSFFLFSFLWTRKQKNKSHAVTHSSWLNEKRVPFLFLFSIFLFFVQDDFLCPFGMIEGVPEHQVYSNSVVPNLFLFANHVKFGILIFHNYLKCLVFLVLFEEIVSF